MSDVEFILGEDEYETTVFAHKIFLVTASTRFHLIFKNQMENSKLLKIKIKNTSKPVMLEVLRFVYTDNAYFTDDNCLGVLEAAMNFDLKALVEKAVDYACKRVDEKTVFKIFEDNQELGNLKINMKCLDYIQT